MSELSKKNPKRVAAGKRGAEAKKIKAELKRKEEELLKKENIELKITKDEASRQTPPRDEPKEKENIEPKQITKDDSTSHTATSPQNYFQLPIISIVVVVGLGFLVYNYTGNTPNNCKKKINELPEVDCMSEENASTIHHNKEVTKPKPPPVKKEIDPFEFT